MNFCICLNIAVQALNLLFCYRPEIPNEVPYQLPPQNDSAKEKLLSVSGKKRCSHCGDELGMS